MAYLDYCPEIWLDGLKKSTKIIRQNSMCIGIAGGRGGRGLGEVAPGGRIHNVNFDFSEPSKFQIMKPKRGKFNN
jgi:hypothetical protein